MAKFRDSGRGLKLSLGRPDLFIYGDCWQVQCLSGIRADQTNREALCKISDAVKVGLEAD